MGAKIIKRIFVHKFVNHKFVNNSVFYTNLTLQKLKMHSFA